MEAPSAPIPKERASKLGESIDIVRCARSRAALATPLKRGSERTRNGKTPALILCSCNARVADSPRTGAATSPGVPVGGRVEKSRARWEPARPPSRIREKSGGQYGWKIFPIPLLLSVLQMETQEKRIRAIAESVKVLTSFVQKTCMNIGPQALEIQPAKISRPVSLNQIVEVQVSQAHRSCMNFDSISTRRNVVSTFRGGNRVHQ